MTDDPFWKKRESFFWPTKDGRPLWWWVGLATLCVQGSEWPLPSRVILCWWH